MLWNRTSKRFLETGLGLALALLLLLVSFSFHYKKGERVSIDEAAEGMNTYQNEAYYLPLVVDTFQWNLERPITLVVDTIYNPVPRAIWKNKPYGGKWFRYFGPKFAPGSLKVNSVHTFGCLAEAHLMLGKFGPVVYGFLWALIVCYIYKMLLTGNTLTKLAIPSYFVLYCYFVCRTGFLGAAFWEACIPMIFFYTFCRIMRETNRISVAT